MSAAARFKGLQVGGGHFFRGVNAREARSVEVLSVMEGTGKGGGERGRKRSVRCKETRKANLGELSRHREQVMRVMKVMRGR